MTGPRERTALVSISVVIPAYNAADTISDAIASVLDQSYAVHEIIVVDDGSSDDTAALVRGRFPNVRVETVANGGPSRARNHGLRLATGEWIAFLDADDRWHPDKLQVQMAVAAKEDVQLVAADWVRGGKFPSLPDPIPTTRLQYKDLLTMNQFQTSTVVMSKRLADSLCGFDPAVDGAEDWDFWLRSSRQTTIIKVDWPLVQYRDVPTGYSKDVWRVYATMQPMLDKHRDTSQLSSAEFATLEAWHHLRFWVAFLLAHEPNHARKAWQNAANPHLRLYLPSAFIRYLIPFLSRRFRRRSKAQ